MDICNFVRLDIEIQSYGTGNFFQKLLLNCLKLIKYYLLPLELTLKGLGFLVQIKSTGGVFHPPSVKFDPDILED